MNKIMMSPDGAAPTIQRKRVLLVDTHRLKRDLRSRIMRKLGLEVDSATDLDEARSLWQADSYSLVLLDVQDDLTKAREFCDEIRRAKPPQVVAFLVGKPNYLAESPGLEEASTASSRNDHEDWTEMVAAMYGMACEGLPRRYGFQEASCRIAALRTLRDPRSAGVTQRKVTDENRMRPSWADAITAAAEKVA